MPYGLGSSSTYYATPNDLKNSYTGVQSQHGSSEPDANMDEFLASVLNHLAYEDQTPLKTEPVNYNGSYSGSDTDGVNAMVSGSSQDTIDWSCNFIHYILISINYGYMP